MIIMNSITEKHTNLKLCYTCLGTYYNGHCNKCINKDMYEPKQSYTKHKE